MKPHSTATAADPELLLKNREQSLHRCFCHRTGSGRPHEREEYWTEVSYYRPVDVPFLLSHLKFNEWQSYEKLIQWIGLVLTCSLKFPEEIEAVGGLGLVAMND